MKVTPKMQAFITLLMKKHENDFIQCPTERRLRLERDGFLPLCLMVTETTVSVAQEVPFDEGGNTDPAVLFSTVADRWFPVLSSRDGRLSRFYAVPDRSQGKTLGHFIPVPDAEEEQAQEALLCEMWAQELEEQGWLDDTGVEKETAA